MKTEKCQVNTEMALRFVALNADISTGFVGYLACLMLNPV